MSEQMLDWCTPITGKPIAHVFLSLPDGRYRVLCGNMKRDTSYVPESCCHRRHTRCRVCERLAAQ